MKGLNLSQILVKDFFVMRIPKFRWGGSHNYTSNFYYLSTNHVFLNKFFLFLNLKKIISLVNKISFDRGICLSYFLDKYKKFFINSNKYYTKNSYIVFINKMFSFLSNFIFFLKNIDKFKRYTNYRSKRFPSIVFLSKKVWKTFDSFVFLFIKLRLISIKSISFLDSENSGTYNILIGKCSSIYFLLNSIYFLNNLKIKKW